MKTIITAAFALSASFAAAAAEPVELTLKVDVKKGQTPRLYIALSFDGEADGETVVALPNEWGGEKQLYLAIRDVKTQNASLSPGAERHLLTLRHAPSARVTLSYAVVTDGAGPPAKKGGNDYRARIGSDLIFFLGDTIVPQPGSLDENAPAKVSFEGIPNGMNWASDLQHPGPKGSLTFRDLIESVFMAGDIRLIDAGGGARLAIYGKIDERDDQGWRDAFANIATAQRRYWGAAEEPYLVTILTSPPQAEGFISVGGTGRSDAFAFFTTTNAGGQRLDQILAHEMMHTWIPRRIGKMPAGENEPLAYWISEGFTDWATLRVLARSGYWNPQQFAGALNEFLKTYDFSPVRAEPNARILKDFWNDRNVGDLPYRRGAILGLLWDAQIRKATQNARDFDDVLWRMQEIERKAPETPVRETFVRAMKDVASIDAGAFLTEHVDKGVPIELPTDAFAPCGDLEWIDRAAFHRGFDIEATQKNDNIVTGVVKGGPAERAGLRDGMKLVKRSGGEIGNSQIEIAYDVIDGESPKTLRWMPEGAARERFRRLTLDSNLAGERKTACQQRLGGL